MKERLIRQLLTTSSGTLATLTGETKYARLDEIVARAIEIVSETPENVIEAFSDDGEWFSLCTIEAVLKTAMEAI